MKVTIGSKIVNVPDEFIERNMRALGITKDEAVELFLTDEGFLDNEEQDILNEKAKAAGPISHDAGAKSKRKAPERKPDMVKRAVIEELAAFVSFYIASNGVEITNIERMIAFEIDGEKFELTLTKKRKPKE